VAAALSALLAAAIGSAGRVVTAQSTATATADELRAIARIDDLTGALNRRAFLEAVETALVNARREGCHVTVAVCDLDGLKAINDAHGHPTGDAALRAFVDVLAANLRGYDAVGRLGGDEFGLLLPGTEEEATAKILDRLSRSIAKDPTGVAEVRASFGTARFPDDGTTRDELIAAADRRLYEDKSRPRTP
jgi:diguanylate cyclase (GGDEF)-like protein